MLSYLCVLSSSLLPPSSPLVSSYASAPLPPPSSPSLTSSTVYTMLSTGARMFSHKSVAAHKLTSQLDSQVFEVRITSEEEIRKGYYLKGNNRFR